MNSTDRQLESYSTCPYKDDRPLNTIHRIRRIISGLDTIVVESHWINNLDSIYSCRIHLPGMDVGTNGKGSSPEYALAAAYAEFMERLQNFWLFPTLEINPESIRRHGFTYDPLEKVYSSGDFPSLPQDFRSARVTPDREKTVFDDWEDTKKTCFSPNKPLPFIPFFQLQRQTIEYLPWDYLKHLYWSNGMCAGNSPEEALSQGLSEILERYAQREIFYGSLTPPTIPRDYLRRHTPHIYGLVREMEKAANLTVIIKDCSLNIGLPVIGVLFFFNDSNTYALKFGADPVLPIALERCLTEFLQGRPLIGYPRTTPLDLVPDSDFRNDPEDHRRFLLGGPGRFPNALFDTDFSYPFSGFSDPGIASTADKLKFLVRLISGMNRSIYVRDVSFLGFDSYCILVPGLSEHLSYGEQRWENLKNRSFSDFSRLSYLSRMDQLADRDLLRLADGMQNRLKIEGDRKDLLFSEYVGYPCAEESPWNRLTLDLVLCMIRIRLGNYEEAHTHLGRFLAYARRQESGSDLKFYSVLGQFLALMARGRKMPDQAEAILRPLMGEEMVRKVHQLFHVREDIFRHLALPQEWHCDRCQVAQYCHYPQLETLYLKVKDRLEENPRDQRLLAGYFD